MTDAETAFSISEVQDRLRDGPLDVLPAKLSVQGKAANLVEEAPAEEAPAAEGLNSLATAISLSYLDATVARQLGVEHLVEFRSAEEPASEEVVAEQNEPQPKKRAVDQLKLEVFRYF